ncbi:MAG: type II toxin-antitoxin system HicB family antitoxin [Verrucomicrobia bacterium]|nr:MAG: type II toxin-antitoxin system HicB family antitoxin [Verrucomicrobiota bacterium]
MRYSVVLELLPAEEGMPGYYYAHVPSLGLTTHGLGMEGALEAARDLVKLWNEEKRANGESITTPSEAILTTVEVA